MMFSNGQKKVGEILQRSIQFERERPSANGIVESIVGDATGTKYLSVTMDPTKPGQREVVIGSGRFTLPVLVESGLTLSQRVAGYTHAWGLVAVDNNGNINRSSGRASDLAISANITVATNVATITFATPHGLHGGDIVYLKGCQDSRLNVGWTPVVSVVSLTSITIALTIANGTYTVGASGFVEEFCPVDDAESCFALVMGGAQTTSQGQMMARMFGNPRDLSAAASLTTNYLVPTVPSGYSTNYTNAQQPTALTKINVKHNNAYVQTQLFGSGSIGSQLKLNRTIPPFTETYRMALFAYAQDNICIPVGGGIASISKAGSTTTTIVFRSAHGLTTSDWVTLYGVRDQTNFVNTTTAVVVTSVDSPTQIKILVAGTGTATSYGGAVMKMQGANTVSNVSSSIQSAECTTAGILTLTFLASQGAHLVGETMYAYGLVKSDGSGDFAATGWAEGMYRIVKNDTATFKMELTVPGLETFASVNIGGTCIKAVSLNLSDVKIESYNRDRVEVTGGGDGIADANEGVGVTILGDQVSSTAKTVAGAAAHDAAVSGNPLRMAVRALTAFYTAVSTGDTADLISTLAGALIVRKNAIPEAEWQSTDNFTGSTTAILAKALLASNKQYLTDIFLQWAALSVGGPLQIGSVAVASTTATIASNILVMSASYAFKVGDMVYVTASSVTGLSAGSYYYIRSVSGANLTFSATRGGTELAISGSSVAATLRHILHIVNLPTAAGNLQLSFATPKQSGTGLGIEICTPVSTGTGRIDVSLGGYTAP